MLTCQWCKALIGAPATAEPHASLRMRDSILCEQGELEKYRCHDCGTLWDRFKADLTFQGKPPSWQTAERRHAIARV
jgi:hypothetical protein